MTPISAADLLRAWEEAERLDPTRRAVALAALGSPGTPSAEIAGWPVGRRDALLLEIRQALFGESLTATAACPACRGRVEIPLSTLDLRVEAPALPASLSLTSGDYCVDFRPPTSLDLAALSSGPEDAGARLLARCVHSARRAGAAVTVQDLPSEVVGALEEALEAADPQARIRIQTACPGCGEVWSTALDIASFLWAEIHTWALRTLSEVDELASAYGWSESEILALSARRRRAYLDRVRR